MAQINLVGMDKAVVLAALYNASKPQGMGFLHYDPTPMSIKEAHELLEEGTYFDYFKGRVMKIDLSGDTLNTWGYDRDNGDGAAEKAINAAVQNHDVNNAEIQGKHQQATQESAVDLEGHLSDKSSFQTEGGIPVFHLGVDGFAEHLRPKIGQVKGKLKANKVESIFMDCLFKEGENHEHIVEAKGPITHVGFHPDRLTSHKQEIEEMLQDLPDDFHSSKGGGMSFLNACMDKYGNQWGEHQTMEQLFLLGMAIKKVECLMPREFWPTLPGGMPYYVIND